MTKVFISQPMTGFTEEDILFKRQIEKTKIRMAYGDDVEFADNYIPEDIRYREELRTSYTNKYNWDIHWISEAIKCMADCDILWLTEGWQDSKGCNIEREVADTYGIEVLYPAPKED